MKILATFISGIKCLKRVLNLNAQNRILLPELAVVDFGLDLAANLSRNPANRQPSPRTCSDPATIAQAAAGWPRWSARTDKQPVYKQNLQPLKSDFYTLSVPIKQGENEV
jgi:hypothetical protein